VRPRRSPSSSSWQERRPRPKDRRGISKTNGALAEKELLEDARNLGRHPFWACKRTQAEILGILDRLRALDCEYAFVDAEGRVFPATKDSRPAPGLAVVRMALRNVGLKQHNWLSGLYHAVDAAHALQREEK
jgi:hypothetical protein